MTKVDDMVALDYVKQLRAAETEAEVVAVLRLLLINTKKDTSRISDLLTTLEVLIEEEVKGLVFT
jgi:hypothetical protein